jgi:hypothetical protein
MKRLFLSAALALLAPVAAFAQTYGTNTVPTFAGQGAFGCTIAGSAATNINAFIDITKEKDLAISIRFAADAAGTANLIAYFSPSLATDTNYAAKGLIALPIAANNAGLAVIDTTNLTYATVGGYGYVLLRYITNASASGNFTNVTVTYSLKKNAS